MVLLVLIEIVAPLASPFLEETIVHGRVNFLGLLNANFALIFSPTISIPLIVQFAQHFVQKNNRIGEKFGGILDLENI